ncbi:hypothetical protein Tco_0966049 [Tanacetum coccineum]
MISMTLRLVFPPWRGVTDCMSPPIRRKYHDSVAFATGCKKIKKCRRDHPQLQQGNLMNEFAPHRLPQPKGNMNGWLIENEEEVERDEVDSDLESTASSKPVWEKTTEDDHDRASRNCPWCSK